MSQVPQIAPLPPAPRRSDAPEDFSAKADALAAAQPGFVAQANTLAEFVNQRSIDADASAASAAESASAAEADRADVSANAAIVSANTATVVARADEVATNTLAVASNAAQVAQDAADVAAALASVADGPVTSVNGKTGVVELSAADVNAVTLAQAHATALSF